MPATPNLPTPDFTFDPNASGACIAGVRPYRNSSYRLDAERISGKFIVHNYGHGGAWPIFGLGVAPQVGETLPKHLYSSPDNNCAMLGVPVIGVIAATLLARLVATGQSFFE